MYLMSAGRYKPAWIGSLIGNIGWIYLSFASDLPGMSFYCIVMLGIAGRGLWKSLSLVTKHHILAYIGVHSTFSDGILHPDESITWEQTCSDCPYTTRKDKDD
jgi:hypothetical protein